MSDQFYKNGKRRWRPNKSWSQKRIRQWLTESPVAGPGSFDCRCNQFYQNGKLRTEETISVYLKPGWTFDHSHSTHNQFYFDLHDEWWVYPCDCKLCVVGDYSSDSEGWYELVKEWKADWYEKYNEHYKGGGKLVRKI